MKTSAARGGIYLTVSSLLFIAISYLINVWLGKKLGPNEFGIYGLVISLLTALNVIQTAGVPQSLSKFIAEDHANSESILYTSIVIQTSITIFITAILFVFAGAFANLLNDNELTNYIRLSSLILPTYGLLTLYMGFYNGLHQFKKQALISIIYSISKFISVMILTILFQIKGTIYGFIASTIPACLYGLHFPKNPKRMFNAKKMILFSLPLIGFSIISTLQYSIDIFFVKAILKSNESSGYYAASQNISRIPFFALSAFSQVIFPIISESVQYNQQNRIKNIIHQSLRLNLLLLLPAIILISITSSQLVELLYSKQYYPAANYLPILTIGLGILSIYSILASILSGAGKPYVSFAISILGLVTTSILCILLIPTYQLLGAAISTTVGAAASLLFASITVQNKFNALIQPITLIRISIASLFMYLIGKSVQISEIGVFIYYPIFICLYLMALILLKEINKSDLELVSSFNPVRKRT